MKLPTYEYLSPEQDLIVFGAPYENSGGNAGGKSGGSRYTGRLLITGPPGTGKTVMAIYRAITAKERGLNVAMVMYNNVLKRYTRDNTEEEIDSSKIITWHRWFREWHKRAFGKIPPTVHGERYIYEWNDIIKNVATTNDLMKLKKLAWGHLIIDEGQDFPNKFYAMANIVVHLTADKEKFGTNASSITVCADDNQRLDQNSNSTIDQIKSNLAIRDEQHYKLTINYRNTTEIAKLASHFFTGLITGISEIPDNPGDVPSFHFHNRLYDSVEFIKRYSKTNDHHTIGIFAPSKRIQKSLFNRLSADNSLKVQKFTSGEEGKWGKAENLELDKPGYVTVLCYQSCKGLEFDAVFIPELQTYNPDAQSDQQNMMNFYVMSSRAREKLFFMCSDCDKDPQILRLFPDDEDVLLSA